MDMPHRRTFILFIPCVQALSDLCEALISCDALFFHDGGLHCHLETALLVGGREGGEWVERSGSGEENGGERERKVRGWGGEKKGNEESKKRNQS